MPDSFILLKLAQDIAENAIRVFKKDVTKYRGVEKNLARDVKVMADKSLEAIIVKRLIKESPYPILTEESGFLGNKGKNSNYYWIVDPLDGSFNFSRGIPISCISIALWIRMEPLLGIVYDFNRDETFSGLVGEGAWLNKEPIMISKTSRKSNAVLCTGFPVSTNFSQQSLLDFVEDIKKYKKIRLFGSAALSLAYVACGRADIYSENNIKVWDVAAGIALVKAAGGIVHYRPRSKKNVFSVVASNQSLSYSLPKFIKI